MGLFRRDSQFHLVKRYDVVGCMGQDSPVSGILGPKRQEDDWQIPEGFYHIDRFQPDSKFYISLGIGYPNTSDKILGVKDNLGCDIFIHGGCATVGCIPITDDQIKELYLVALETQSNSERRIPVHIFPARLMMRGWRN